MRVAGILFVLLLVCSSLSAQVLEGPERFGDVTTLRADNGRKAINAYLEMLSLTPNVRGLIVIFGKPKQFAAEERRLLAILGRRTDPHITLTIVNGGDCEPVHMVLWTVPRGAPTDSISVCSGKLNLPKK